MPAYIPKATRHDWQTPTHVVQVVRKALGGEIWMDPCASADPFDHFALRNVNPGPFVEHDNSMRTFHEDSPRPIIGDGLVLPWEGTVFVNPPFSENAKWVRKAACEHAVNRVEIILLIPARTDTKYWQDDCALADAVCFWRGRLRFSGAQSSAPFPVAFVYWGRHSGDFFDSFSPHGQTIRG